MFVVYSKYICMFPVAYCTSESQHKDVHVSFKGIENIFLLENVQSTLIFLGVGGGKIRGS